MADARTPKRPPRPRAASSGPKPTGRIRLVQIGSPIGRQGYQRETLKGLGLNKLHRSSVLEDTPAVRGMIESVKHLLQVESAT